MLLSFNGLRCFSPTPNRWILLTLLPGRTHLVDSVYQRDHRLLKFTITLCHTSVVSSTVHIILLSSEVSRGNDRQRVDCMSGKKGRKNLEVDSVMDQYLHKHEMDIICDTWDWESTRNREGHVRHQRQHHPTPGMEIQSHFCRQNNRLFLHLACMSDSSEDDLVFCAPQAHRHRRNNDRHGVLVDRLQNRKLQSCQFRQNASHQISLDDIDLSRTSTNDPLTRTVT